jgi:hypothetical protein
LEDKVSAVLLVTLRGIVAKVSEFIVPVNQVFLVLIGTLPLSHSPAKYMSCAVRSGLLGRHSFGFKHSVHQPVKRLSSHAPTGSTIRGLSKKFVQ